MNFKLIGAIVKKDVSSLAPLVALTALLFFADPIIVRLDLLPAWTNYNLPVVLVALIVLILPVVQLDSAASLTDDWLCRPVPARDLVVAKLALLVAAVYLPRAIGTFAADLSLGLPLSEALLDAVLLRDKPLLLLVPLFLLIAIVTRTFVQGFGVLFAIFVCVFVIPTPFLRPPGPLEPGIREYLTSAGLEWVGSTPARMASIALVAGGFWLVYWRRRLAAARVLLVLTVCALLFFMALPMVLLPWNTTFALQQASGPGPTSDTARISLRNPRVCLPAARFAELTTDAEFVAATQRNGLTLWDEEEELAGLGENSVAFFTDVEPRGLPLDWRAKLNYVQADYAAGGKTLYSLRPARYITDQAGAGSLTHAWMLPEHAVQKLRDLQPTLDLTYSLTLLKPREYRVPTDGKRHKLPGLGFCSAVVNGPGNRIHVDCFSAFSHPAQISAQLNEIPASRAYSRADFAPAYAQWPFSKRVGLAVESPRLAKHETITVIAWDVASYLQKSLELPGLLGADLATCPLPLAGGAARKSRWRDAAPHEPYSIRVDDGVQLEVLDFGGEGTPLLLLPGLGATAHSYDELAPLLAQKHRVVAMTRRGTGYSSKPDFGFDTPRLARDVLRVMDAMKLEKVVLVGHSIAGDELTWLGGHHADRFGGLVYLDAAYDRSGDPKSPAALRLRELRRLLPPEPPFAPRSLENFATMTQMLLERGHVALPEGELIAFHRMNDPYLAGAPNIDARTQQAISAAIEAPDYASLKIPALAIFAFADPGKPLPFWYDANDGELIASLAEIDRLVHAQKRRSIELFEANVERGQIQEMRNATHYIFQSNRPEVLESIERFVDGLSL